MRESGIEKNGVAGAHRRRHGGRHVVLVGDADADAAVDVAVVVVFGRGGWGFPADAVVRSRPKRGAAGAPVNHIHQRNEDGDAVRRRRRRPRQWIPQQVRAAAMRLSDGRARVGVHHAAREKHAVVAQQRPRGAHPLRPRVKKIEARG